MCNLYLTNSFEFFARQCRVPLRTLALQFAFILGVFVAGAMVAHAEDESARLSPKISITSNTNTHRDSEPTPFILDNESESDVFGVGRSVVVRGNAKRGVMALGGDVFVEGHVEGDVAAIGGSVIQREGSYIGGDVLVFGGAYHHGKGAPGRNPASATIMVAGYEQELREMMRDPKTLLTPHWSLAAIGLRLFFVLCWFVLSLILTTMLPNAVSRAAARLQLTSLQVAIIGLLGAIVAGVGVPAALKLLPPALGIFVSAFALLTLLGSYLFGRVVIQAATGRWLQRVIFREERQSESVALLIGALFWGVVLSLPYIWVFAVAGVLVTSLGLTLTASKK